MRLPNSRACEPPRGDDKVSTRTQALSLVSAYKRTRERMDFRDQDQGTVKLCAYRALTATRQSKR